MFARPLAALALLLLPGCMASDLTGRAIDHSPGAWAQTCADWDEWDKPGPPFRIHGDTYYVGTCGISAILIAGDEGHVLIDSGTEAGARIVAGNIEALGFKLTDVKELLMSHEHFDHVGGMAWLQQQTGARLVTSGRAVATMRSGRADPDDPQAGMHEPMAAVGNVFDLAGADGVLLGDTEVRAVDTPGHTPGALSWHWRSCEEGECLWIGYVDSLSPVSRDDYRFSDHPAYLAGYRQSLARLAALECDIVIAPHPTAAALRARLLGETPLAAPESCKAYAEGIGARLDALLAQEASGG
jgi:metallo-beta-lactamase class B